MQPVHLIFGTYNSQPVGNFHEVIENVYQQAYKPFISILNRYPEFPVTLYYSGYLLEWLENNHPEFFMLLDEMIKRKQVELLGGGYYEPIFTTIPQTSIIGQAESLTTYLRVHFGKRPRGVWLPERAWDPSLISLLKGGGFEYTFLDDNYLKYAGAEDDALHYPCITEDQGRALTIFPLSRHIRSLIPDSEPGNLIDQIRRIGSRDREKVVVIFEDGAKFGEWSNSNKKYYSEGWLNSFIKCLTENQDWLVPVHPGRFNKTHSCLSLYYLPATLNEEMNGWLGATLGLSDRQTRKSGNTGRSFKDFYRKYSESYLMYAKMMYVKILVNQIKGDKYKKRAARDELWKGQCNSAYWHGLYGGIYFNHLRKAVYRSLIEAEKLTREKGIFLPSIVTFDFDMDGKDEYLYQGLDINGYIHLRGGMLFELDFLPVSWNYLDTFRRYYEPYHADLKAKTPVDGYLRKAFLDHFLEKRTKINSLRDADLGVHDNFVNAVYEVKDFNREKNELILECEGEIGKEDRSHTVRIEKKYRFKRKSIVVNYKISSSQEGSFDTVFGLEINLALASNNTGCQELKGVLGNKTIIITEDFSDTPDLSGMIVNDLCNNVQIKITASEPFSLWNLPVKTQSRTHERVENIYQSTCLVPRWDIKLEPESVFELEIELALSEIK
ncbi:MAG: DUF1926 domain-containing protein [Spirochaetales bacterium]|nr:DUF1926 domain-containing protein [Spirochaetales bacterium]